MGERLLGRWLRQPLVDKLKLEARLDMVQCLKDDAMLRGSLQVRATGGEEAGREREGRGREGEDQDWQADRPRAKQARLVGRAQP